MNRDNLEKTFAAKMQKDLEIENKKIEKNRISTSSGDQKVLKQLRSELNNRPLEAEIILPTETLLREKMSSAEMSNLSSKLQKDIHEVMAVRDKFQTNQEIQKYCETAWDQLSKSNEGKVLLNETGGKNRLLDMMNEGKHRLISQSAYYSERPKVINKDAIGRNIHKMAELYDLEKNSKKILNGNISVEQRIDYSNSKGKAHWVEIDHIHRLQDGRIHISDYKPINLSQYEATEQGKKWANWASKEVGNDFREKIMKGDSPFFSNQTKGQMPPEIRSDLRKYLSSSVDKYKIQLEKYRRLTSEAYNIDQTKVGVSVHPYFLFENI